MSTTSPRLLPNPRRSGGFVGIGGLACLLFIILGAARALPWWGVVLMVAFWLVLLVVATRWFTPHPVRVMLLPVVGFAVWVGAVLLSH
ncbi:MAG: hypothetical protein JWO46_1719 [Nocardioidaceae bacterium]|nr:hypothetical protein [Nocardioidaceae bacterium]